MCAQDQFEQHVRPDVKLNVYLYYGSARNRSKKFLSSQDVVITTYNVLSADFSCKVSRCAHMGDDANVVQTVLLNQVI